MSEECPIDPARTWATCPEESRRSCFRAERHRCLGQPSADVETKNLQKELEPKGGVVENFVYEPIGNGFYVWKWCKQRGISELTQGSEKDEEVKKEVKYWRIEANGHEFRFKKSSDCWMDSFLSNNLPYRTLRIEDVGKWVAGEFTSKGTQELFNLVENYVKLLLDLEERYEAKVLALHVFQTWLTRVLNTVFNVDISGPFGGGKTTALEALAEICFHGVLGTTSSSNLGRMNEKYDISWVIDEYDKAKKADKERLMNVFIRQGYRRGNRIYRHNADTGKEEWFNAFGPKAISYHETLEKALSQRSLMHVALSKSIDYKLPVINTVRQQLSPIIFRELFFWYMDNIAEIKAENSTRGTESTRTFEVWVEAHFNANREALTENPSGTRTFGTFGMLSKENVEEERTALYEAIVKDLNEGERTFLKQLQARGCELGFLAIKIARLIGVDFIQHLKEALERKTLEEEESEFDPESIVEEILAVKIHREGRDEIPQREVFEETKDRVKKEYGLDLTTHKFASIIRDIGFRERVTIKRRGKGRPRILFISELIKKKIPVPDDNSTPRQSTQPTLDAAEKRQAILKAIGDLERRIGHAHITNIAYEIRNKILEGELKPLLESLQREGLVFEAKPDCWRLTKE